MQQGFTSVICRPSLMRVSRPDQGSNGLPLLRASSLSVIGVISCLLATSSIGMSAGGEESTQQQDKRAREFSEFGVVKRLHSPTRSLDDWRKVGCGLRLKQHTSLISALPLAVSLVFIHGFLRWYECPGHFSQSWSVVPDCAR